MCCSRLVIGVEVFEFEKILWRLRILWGFLFCIFRGSGCVVCLFFDV